MNKYFKFIVESDLGVGTQYIEFDGDNWAIRQAECHEGRWFNSAEKKYHSELGGIALFDQQLTELGMKRGKPIDVEEFELVWKLSSLKLEPTNLENKELERKRSGFYINQNSSNRVLVSGSGASFNISPDKQGIDSPKGETDSTL